MAELVVGPLVSMVQEKVSSYLLDQYKVMEGMEEQRKILERKLPAILDIIQDAEEKGADKPGVRAWLQNVKAVSYEAIDVFDELKYEALRREAQKKGHQRIKALTTFPARNPIVFRYRMGKKLLKIVQTIETLVNEMNTFGFRHMQQAPAPKQGRKTDPTMVDSDKDIISKSREEEKRKIMKILFDEASGNDLTVLPIDGMGGLGKTTFVQLIYNDPAIKKHFEPRRWCCVPNDFDAANIARELCQTNINDDKGHEKALQDLQSLISGKRFLIVLDDVWKVDDDKWGKLKSCLKYGGKGSAVLITTRNLRIAQRMATGVHEIHSIEKLSNKHLKELVECRAFSFQKPIHEKLDEIVDQIVDRCVGSPLAAKAIGSMLSTKTSMSEWKDILAKSSISDKAGILPILKLSFDDLPSHMKQCFAFCAIFPKDYDIDVDLLVQLWMAHDLLPMQEDNHPEMVGTEIHQELTWRSFFQDVKQKSSSMYGDRFGHRKKTTCKMHDLMHDIALSVMGKECVVMVDSSSTNTLLLDPTRHAFMEGKVDKRTVLDKFLNKQSPTIRTLFFTTRSSPIKKISKCTSLRVLHIPHQKGYPVGMKFLKHLRYLNLSTLWSMEELPEDISVMYNLQTLDLSGCNNLRHLPKDMKYMASLRHLYTRGCTSLACMPPGIGQITSLRTITYFVVGAGGSGCSTIGELQCLDLGDELELTCLENATEDHAKEAGLKSKERLTHLSLEWKSEGEEEKYQECHKKVLHALEPYRGLEMLRIVNYKGTTLPSWVSHLSVLTELYLCGCVFCDEFPQFCDFKALQVLSLKKLDKLQSLCSDAVSMPFQVLKQLELHDLVSLEGWVTTKGKELVFPILEKIDIKKCPKLTSLPEAPNLKDIKLLEDRALLSIELIVMARRYMPSLSTLELSILDTEEVTPPLIVENHESSLSVFKLHGCQLFFSSHHPSQPTFGAWKWFVKLVSLEIYNCDALIFWPEDVFQHLLLLKTLIVESCKKLKGRTKVQDITPTETADQVLPQLNTLMIIECERLEQLFILPASLKSIYIMFCPTLEFVFQSEEHPETYIDIQPEHSHDHASTSMEQKSLSPTNHHSRLKLETLQIGFCSNLATLTNLPPSLKELRIRSCQNLCSMLGHHLDALEGLHLSNCNKLQSLNSLGNLPSLETLDLENCQCIASLPGVLGSYSALRSLNVKYCPAIDLKPLYKHHQQRLDRLEVKNISHAHSSNPYKGPKLMEPRSWKYAIPGVQRWTRRRHQMED